MKTGYLVSAFFLIVFVAVLAGWFMSLSPFFDGWQIASQNGMRTLLLDGQQIHVSVADTDAERQQGLGGRAGLAYDEGMLFIFDTDGRYSFWMKDMLFPIDMLWLGDDGTVVYMAQNVSPDTYPQSFTPDTSARYVLELPANYVMHHGVKVGDIVQL
jgi:uncharacterized membrane protein (UPF0127 family)